MMKSRIGSRVRFVHLELKVFQFVEEPSLVTAGGGDTVRFAQRRPERPLGGAAGRAGVGQRAGLLLVLGRRRHGDRRVLTLGGAAFAAEQLALDFPEVVAVVKPGEHQKKKTDQEKGNGETEQRSRTRQAAGSSTTRWRTAAEQTQEGRKLQNKMETNVKVKKRRS